MAPLRKALVVTAALLGGFVWGQEKEDKGGGGDVSAVGADGFLREPPPARVRGHRENHGPCA